METNPYSRVATATVAPATAIRDALRRLDEAGTGALLVCDEDLRLLGLITDGDIRRAILRGIPLDSPCGAICTRDPVVIESAENPEQCLALMNRLDIHHLPVADEAGRVTAFLLRSDLDKTDTRGCSAVIMAGGYGKRLHPLTAQTPKPMLALGEKPLLALTISRLQESGIRHVNVTTHYLAEQIQKHFGDGSDYGVQLTYVNESHPLGTVGGLSLLKEIREPMLVINGDILTGMSFRHIVDYHKEVRAFVTMGVRQFESQVPYGVVECDGPYVRCLREKPRYTHLVNAGIYVIDPAVHRFIPAGKRYDMTDLIQRLIDAGRPVVSFPIVEYWLDIGQPADYAKAQEDVKNGKIVA